MSRVLITRPQPDADRTAALVRAAGHDALVHPLMRIVPRASALEAAPEADALAFTSANGVRAYAAAGGVRRPVFAVGEASAGEAERFGFEVAAVAAGDVASLSRVIAAARPDRLLHPSGAKAAGDLAGALRDEGIECARVVLYDAVAATSLPSALLAEIGAGLDWVMLHSPRSARLLSRLVRRAGMEDAFRQTGLAALSAAVAAEAALPFGRTVIAARPASSALVDIIGGRDT